MKNKPDINQMTKKERIEYLRNLKKETRKTESRMGLIIGILLVLGVILAVVGLYLFSNSAPATSEKELGSFVAAPAPPNDHVHVNPGETHAPYTSNPPSSGPHYNAPGLGPIPCKAFDKPVTDEGVVHNLEHGAVWISYKDENDSALAKKLDDLASRFSKVVVSPRPNNDAPIAAVAWERVLKLQTFDQQKLEDFIKIYRDQANLAERFGPCG